jgi:hypothetical protein
MDYVLNVQSKNALKSNLLMENDMSEAAAEKMVGHLDRRVVGEDLTHFEELAMSSEFVSASPVEDVTGPNTMVEDGYVVSTL